MTLTVPIIDQLVSQRTRLAAGSGEVFAYLFLFLGLLYPWNQIGLQFHLYWGDAEVERVIIYSSALSVLVLIAFGLTARLPEKVFAFVVAYVFLTLFFYLLVIAGGEGAWFRYLGVLFVAGALLWILSDQENLKRFVNINFLIGMSLICLNSVTLLHWYCIVDLTFESVPRVGGNSDGSEAHLNPLSFGIFGRTENQIHPNAQLGSARLQGWSSEPLHWAYFVYWTLTCALMLLVDAGKGRTRVMLSIAILIIAVHLIYLQSTAAYIVASGVILTVLFLGLLRLVFFIKSDFLALLLATVIVPGIFIPFGLSLVPGVTEIFLSGNLLGEQGNWGGKISFLTLGNDLMARILPDPAAYQPVSHNLILSMYVQGGYLFLIPLLAFFYYFLKSTTMQRSLVLSCILALTIVTNTLGVETAFFSPFGVMWFSVVYAFMHYRHVGNWYLQNIHAEGLQKYRV